MKNRIATKTKTKIQPKTIRSLRSDYLTGKYKIVDLAAKYNISVSYTCLICHNNVYFDPSYLPSKKIPVDIKYMLRLKRQGFSFEECSRREQEFSGRRKPLSAECIRKKLRSYEYEHGITSL